MAGAQAARPVAFDRLRTALMLLVIAHHTAITDGGSGGWFDRAVRGAAPAARRAAGAVSHEIYLRAMSAPARRALIHHVP